MFAGVGWSGTRIRLQARPCLAADCPPSRLPGGFGRVFPRLEVDGAASIGSEEVVVADAQERDDHASGQRNQQPSRLVLVFRLSRGKSLVLWSVMTMADTAMVPPSGRPGRRAGRQQAIHLSAATPPKIEHETFGASAFGLRPSAFGSLPSALGFTTSRLHSPMGRRSRP